jgi:hypothetical protein
MLITLATSNEKPVTKGVKFFAPFFMNIKRQLLKNNAASALCHLTPFTLSSESNFAFMKLKKEMKRNLKEGFIQ